MISNKLIGNNKTESPESRNILYVYIMILSTKRLSRPRPSDREKKRMHDPPHKGYFIQIIQTHNAPMVGQAKTKNPFIFCSLNTVIAGHAYVPRIYHIIYIILRILLYTLNAKCSYKWRPAWLQCVCRTKTLNRHYISSVYGQNFDHTKV